MLEEKLLDAVKAKDYEAVKKLIAEGADVNYLRDTGMSPLLYAESEDDVKMAKILLDSGADINFRYPPRKQNLLQMAALESRKEMIELFLQYKPDINNRDGFGNNALWSACHAGDMGIIELLLQHGVTYGVSEYDNPAWETSRPELMLTVASTDANWGRVLAFIGANMIDECD